MISRYQKAQRLSNGGDIASKSAMIYIQISYITETMMRVSKWGNSLAVRIPKDVATALGIGEGDEVKLTRCAPGVMEVSKLTREQAVARIRELARPLPPGWKFDREKANAR